MLPGKKQNQKQRKRVWWMLNLVTFVHFICLVSATTRPFPNDAQGLTPHSLQAGWVSKQGMSSKMEEKTHEEAFKGLGTLGSRPPNCDRKCGRCVPCEAIQVPTTTDHVGIQYSNYEPEGWKCKCGGSFYNP